MRWLFALVLLSGCTIAVEDRRITREELAKTFAALDENDRALAQAIERIVKEVTELKGKKK